MSLAVRVPLLPLLDRAWTALGADTGWLVIIGVLTRNIKRLAVRHVYYPNCKSCARARADVSARFQSERATITPDDRGVGRIDRIGLS